MDLELHTSAPAVELANDAARNARCKECDHMQLVYMNTPGFPMRYACKELGFKLCVDICDDACPKSRKRGEEMTDTIDKNELILKIIPLKKNIEECAEEVDGPHWRAYKSSYYRGYLDAVSDILNKINE